MKKSKKTNSQVKQFIDDNVVLFSKATAVIVGRYTNGCEIYLPIGVNGSDAELQKLKDDFQDIISEEDDTKDPKAPPPTDDPPAIA